MEIELAQWVYFAPLCYLLLILLLSTISKKVSITLGIKDWGRFFSLMFVSCIPVFNIIAMIVITISFILELNIPKPRGWK